MSTSIDRVAEHSSQAANRFDRWAGSYGDDRISDWFRHYQALAISKLNVQARPGFLDVGCGTGWAVRTVAKELRSGPCCGVDVSPGMISKALRVSNAPNCHLRVADVHSLPFDDETFGSVLCTCSFHHYGEPIEALREIRRVLKSDGLFALLDSARDVSLPIWLQDRWRRYLELSHVRYYTTTEMGEMLAAAGFRTVGEIQRFKRTMDHGKVFTGLMLAVCRR